MFGMVGGCAIKIGFLMPRDLQMAVRVSFVAVAVNAIVLMAGKKHDTSFSFENSVRKQLIYFSIMLTEYLPLLNKMCFINHQGNNIILVYRGLQHVPPGLIA